MTAEAASDRWTTFTRRGLTLWLPASVNLGIASLLAPAMNALLARAADPEASIAGFAVALGVITIVALPQFRIQQLHGVNGVADHFGGGALCDMNDGRPVAEPRDVAIGVVFIGVSVQVRPQGPSTYARIVGRSSVDDRCVAVGDG